MVLVPLVASFQVTVSVIGGAAVMGTQTRARVVIPVA